MLAVGIVATNTAQATKTESNYAKAKKIIYAVFSQSTEAYALKIAGCETGYTYSKWSTGSQGERGWFQIHPSNAGRYLPGFGSINFNRLYNPWYNTKVAYYMSHHGHSWSEWTCSRIVFTSLEGVK
jgi:hypothetical protein